MDFSYIGAERIWIARRDGVEIVVGGDDDAAAPARLALAERVVAQIEPLTALARKHLDAYIARDRVAPGEDWLLEAIECGRDPADPEEHVQFTFTLAADLYGWWSVTLSAGPAAFYPVELSRRQR